MTFFAKWLASVNYRSQRNNHLKCAFFIPSISALFLTALARATGETLNIASGPPCWILSLVELLLSWVLYLSQADLKTLTIAAFMLEVSSQILVPFNAKLTKTATVLNIKKRRETTITDDHDDISSKKEIHKMQGKNRCT